MAVVAKRRSRCSSVPRLWASGALLRRTANKRWAQWEGATGSQQATGDGGHLSRRSLGRGGGCGPVSVCGDRLL